MHHICTYTSPDSRQAASINTVQVLGNEIIRLQGDKHATISQPVFRFNPNHPTFRRCSASDCFVYLLTLCEATARSTKLRKQQSYKSVFYQKKEALLLITTLPCLKGFVSLITKNKSKSSWYTENFAKSCLKEKSSGRMRTKRQNRKECCFLRSFSSSPGHWQASKLSQEGRVLSDRKIDLQTTLSSRSQLESSAGKPFTSSSANQTPRQELRTTPLQGARMEGSATWEGQKDNFFYRTKLFSKRQHDCLSFSCMHAKNGDAGVTITTIK